METGKAKGASAKGSNRDASFNPANTLGGRDNAQTKVDGVSYCLVSWVGLGQDGHAQVLTRLHAHKRAPYEDGRAVEQARDGVTQDQDYISPVPVDVGLHVVPHSVECRHTRFSADGAISAEKWRFLVCGVSR